MFLFGREYKWHCNHIRINPYLHILQISDSVFLFHNKSRWTTWKMHRRRINSKNETQGQSCFAIYRYIFHKSVLSCLSNFRLQLKMVKSNCRLLNYVEYGQISTKSRSYQVLPLQTFQSAFGYVVDSADQDGGMLPRLPHRSSSAPPTWGQHGKKLYLRTCPPMTRRGQGGPTGFC